MASSSTADRAAFLHRFVSSRENKEEQKQQGVCESLQSGLSAGSVFDEHCAEVMLSTSLFRITGQHLFSSKQEILVCNMTSPDFHGFLCNACLLLLTPKYAAKRAKQIMVSGIFSRFGFHKPKQNHTQCSIKQANKQISIFSGATSPQPWQTHTCLRSHLHSPIQSQIACLDLGHTF